MLKKEQMKLGVIGLAVGLFISFIFLLIMGYYVVQEQHKLRTMIISLETNNHELAQHIDVSTRPIEKVITKSEVWRPIQENIKDEVVQVFSHIASVDILQPFKTPQQYTSYGSGFFITYEDQQLIVTNAHVVNQAKSVWIQIPSLGKRILDVEVIGLSPERDIALLRLQPDAKKIVELYLGTVPSLSLGDSDRVYRSEEVMALGYPLGQQYLKSTTGVISGREHQFIQMSAAINPGNSGGPLLNINGEAVGINSANVPSAQNIGYIIPINDLKVVLPDLLKEKLLRKPFLGVLFNNSTESLTEFLGNPQPGGTYVVEVVKNSTLYKAGVQRGDMIYEINGHRLDIYGDMDVPWCEDKISIIDYVSRLTMGQNVNLKVYRNGQPKEFNITFGNSEFPAIRKIFPGYDELNYEIIAGMVVMELTLDHIRSLIKTAPGLAKYTELQNQGEPALVITHIFPNSQVYRSRSITIGATLNEFNGIKTKTLDDLRNAIKSSIGSKFLTLKVTDNVLRTSDNVLVALSFDKVLREELQLAQDYKYPISPTVQELLKAQLDKASSLGVPGTITKA